MSLPSPATAPGCASRLSGERIGRGANGAGNRNRTYDLIITNDALYQLSYSGAEGLRIIDTEARFDKPGPATASLVLMLPPVFTSLRTGGLRTLPAAVNSEGATGGLDASVIKGKRAALCVAGLGAYWLRGNREPVVQRIRSKGQVVVDRPGGR